LPSPNRAQVHGRQRLLSARARSLALKEAVLDRPRYRRRRLVGDRKARAHVDLAEDVGVGAGRIPRAVEEIQLAILLVRIIARAVSFLLKISARF